MNRSGITLLRLGALKKKGVELSVLSMQQPVHGGNLYFGSQKAKAWNWGSLGTSRRTEAVSHPHWQRPGTGTRISGEPYLFQHITKKQNEPFIFF